MIEHWDFDGTPPAEPGWYEVLICYDEQEGIFPDGAWWDGIRWERKGVLAFGIMKPSQQEAAESARAHDIDG